MCRASSRLLVSLSSISSFTSAGFRLGLSNKMNPRLLQRLVHRRVALLTDVEQEPNVAVVGDDVLVFWK